jgi:hypothetical protein
LPGVGIEVELVLVPQWRLVAGGEEQRLGFGSLGAEPASEELGVGPQRVGVAGGDERGRERHGDVVGDRARCERGVVEKRRLPEYACSTICTKTRPAGEVACRPSCRS